MKKLRVLALSNLSILLMTALSSCAEYSITTPKPAGNKMMAKPVAGKSVYDYKSGTFSSITPNFGGGYDVYNSSTNQFSHIRPDASGGYSIFNYRTSQFSHTNPSY